MSIILIKALQLLLCLSLLVVLHEGGHFLFSRLFHVRVEKFYMFFDYKFYLFSTKKTKWFTRLFPSFLEKETEYGIGWIPLGGYVKIAGMIDESMDKEQMKQPEQPDEFRAQPCWKRFFIMIGGVLMNMIVAFVIYCGIMFSVGRNVMPIEKMTQGFEFNDQALRDGFQQGDIPVAADGQKIDYYDVNILRTIANADVVTVLRNGQEKKITMPGNQSLLEMMKMDPAYLTPVMPTLVQDLIDGPAKQAGVQPKDKVEAILGLGDDAQWTEVHTLVDFGRTMKDRVATLTKESTHADTLAVSNVALALEHADGAKDTVTVALDKDFRFGIYWQDYTQMYGLEHLDYNFFTCIPAGWNYCMDKLGSYVSDLKYVATKDGANSVGSFITIGSIFPDAWNWLAFWNITAFISIILAVMNILPIPGLDGGHVVFLLYEAITRRKPSDKVMTVFEYIGMAILVTLMVFAFKNDLMNFVFK